MWHNATVPLRRGAWKGWSPLKSDGIEGSPVAWDLRFWPGSLDLGQGQGGWGGNEMDAKKPQVSKADVTVTVVDRLLTFLRPVVIVGTVLVICLAVYAMAMILNKR